ncbi:MAG: hypothetical protein IPM88_16410, partial [Nitrospira sp.]|nr:hypothetical protein [Nitrospira sp.]
LFVLLWDMGYYRFNRQHMDFVFLEYVGDLFCACGAIGQHQCAGDAANLYAQS